MTQWITTREAWSLVVPHELDRARMKIFARLIEAEITAWAEHYTFDNAEHRNSEMPPAFWHIQWTRLDFAFGKATRAVYDCFCSINEDGERVVKQHSSDSATGIRLDRDALLAFWPPILPGVEKPNAIAEGPKS